MKLRNHIHFQRQKLRSRYKRMMGSPADQVHLFIMAGPRTASTLLADILDTSENVSRSSPLGEGQFVPELKGLYPHEWNTSKEYDWHEIRRIWDMYWDRSKPVLLDKSTNNLRHAKQIAQVFNPVYFLCLVRNPYAHCESLIRRTFFTPERAANFALECLSYQKSNLNFNSHLVRYEDLTDDTERTIKSIQEWLPQIGDIKTEGSFAYSGIEGIRNTNAEKIAKLTDLDVITSIFEKSDLLDYFGYKL